MKTQPLNKSSDLIHRKYTTSLQRLLADPAAVRSAQSSDGDPPASDHLFRASKSMAEINLQLNLLAETYRTSVTIDQTLIAPKVSCLLEVKNRLGLIFGAL